MADILAVDRNASGCHIVEAGQQRTDCSLSAAGRTHQSDRSAGRDLNGYIGKNRCIIITIMKGYILIADSSFYICKINGIGCILDLGNSFHDIEKPSETGKPFLHHFHQFYKNLDRTDKDTNIQCIHCKVCSLHLSPGDQITAIDQCNKIHQSLKK